MKKILSLLAAFALILTASAPALASAQVAAGSVSACSRLQQEGIAGVVKCIVGFFDYAVYLIIALSVLYIIIGAFKMIYSEEKRDEGKDTIKYGIVALFIMMSIWGFVNILRNTFNLNSNPDISNVRIIP